MDPTTLLTRDDVSRLREMARHSQYRRRRGPRLPVAFHGGPLGGVRITVTMEQAASLYLGFCVTTDHGPVQALYSKRDDTTDRHFHECVSGAR